MRVFDRIIVRRKKRCFPDVFPNNIFTAVLFFYTPTTSVTFLDSTIESSRGMRVDHRFTRELLKSSFIGSKR